MHVHLPKPLHGWRAFVGEVGIIVLGVLIALGFGQIVEQWQWHEEVGTTRQALDNELATDILQGAERLAVENCLHDRIGELASKLNATSAKWNADPMPLAPGARPAPHWDNVSMMRVYGAPSKGWSQDAWDAAKSTGILNHMSREEVATYSAVYGEVGAIRLFQDEEIPLQSKLSFLSVDQQLDNSSRVNALQTLGQLDDLNTTITGLGSLLIEQIKGLHLRVDRSAFAHQLKETIANQRRYRGICVTDVTIEL